VVQVRLSKSPLAREGKASIQKAGSLKEAEAKSILDKEDNGGEEV
jgi:hypothetical protein